MYSAEYQNILSQINKLILGESIRVSSKMAKALMLNNQSTIIGGKVYYLCLTNLGLGTYKVELNDAKETKMKK